MRRSRVVLLFSLFAVALCASLTEAQWWLAPAELTVGDDRTHSFADVVDVLVREDLVYVADRGLGRIAAFERSTGNLTAVAGRRVDGPDEFRWLRWIDDCGGDTVLAFRLNPARVSEYSRDLAHIRTSFVDDHRVRLLACAGTGLVGITRNKDPALESQRETPMRVSWRANYDILLFERDGSFRPDGWVREALDQVLGTYPGEERYRIADDRGFSDSPLHWGLRPVLDASPQGFFVGTGETPALVHYDVDGNSLNTMAVGEERVAVSDVHIERLRERVRLGDRDIVGNSSYWREYPYPSHFPSYSKVLVTPASFIWVQRFPEPYTEQPSHWRVFSPDGTLVSSVVLQSDIDLMWVGETHVAGVVTNDAGVQTVELRRIIRD